MICCSATASDAQKVPRPESDSNRPDNKDPNKRQSGGEPLYNACPALTYVTLVHKTSHKSPYFEMEINKLSIGSVDRTIFG